MRTEFISPGIGSGSRSQAPSLMPVVAGAIAVAFIGTRLGPGNLLLLAGLGFALWRQGRVRRSNPSVTSMREWSTPHSDPWDEFRAALIPELTPTSPPAA